MFNTVSAIPSNLMIRKAISLHPINKTPTKSPLVILSLSSAAAIPQTKPRNHVPGYKLFAKEPTVPTEFPGKTPLEFPSETPSYQPDPIPTEIPKIPEIEIDPTTPEITEPRIDIPVPPNNPPEYNPLPDTPPPDPSPDIVPPPSTPPNIEPPPIMPPDTQRPGGPPFGPVVL